MKRLYGFLFAISSMLVMLPHSGLAADYLLDRDHTAVHFSWDHLGMSRQSGRFTEITGRVRFNPAEPENSSVTVRIGVASLQTGVPALDRHLVGTPDFFDVRSFPDITFVSKAVALTTSRTANVSGDLTINGQTHPATLSVVWNFDGEHPLAKVNPTYSGVYALGFSARTKILRSRWGIARSIPLVSDEIRIVIETEMLRR
ncbi:MAG: YceI family protein [Pseudomonadota bacterium]